MTETTDPRVAIVDQYKKYLLTRVGIAAPVFLLGVVAFVFILIQFAELEEVPMVLYGFFLVCIVVLLVGLLEIYRTMFWFRPGKCEKLLVKEPEKMEYVGVEKHWTGKWKLEFGSYGAETYRIVAAETVILPFFRTLISLNPAAPVKFPDEWLPHFSITEQNDLLPRRVDRPKVSY